MNCVHHYIIDRNNNGRCKLCGHSRVFDNRPIKFNNKLFPLDLTVGTNRDEVAAVDLYDI